MSWLKALLALLGLGNKVADIVKTKQENTKLDRAEKQGEQNANARTTAKGLEAMVNADAAARDPAVVDRVRDEFRRP